MYNNTNTVHTCTAELAHQSNQQINDAGHWNISISDHSIQSLTLHIYFLPYLIINNLIWSGYVIIIFKWKIQTIDLITFPNARIHEYTRIHTNTLTHSVREKKSRSSLLNWNLYSFDRCVSFRCNAFQLIFCSYKSKNIILSNPRMKRKKKKRHLGRSYLVRQLGICISVRSVSMNE